VSFASVSSADSRAYSPTRNWTSRFRKEHQGLTGYLDDVMCNANGPSTPGLLDSLAVSVNRSIAFQHAKTLGRIQQKPCFRSSIPFRAGRYSLTFHPHYLSVYASTGDFGDTPYTQAATLDTGPVASSYPGGSHTRSSSNYFQSALASHGSSKPLSRRGFCRAD